MRTPRVLVAFLGAAVASFIVASCGPAPKPCGPATCADGCCDEAGECLSGTALFECGGGGAACVACAANEVCLVGACGRFDGGEYDANFPDAPDAHFNDAGVFDAGPFDAGGDAGFSDAGRDAGTVDAGALDAGRADAGLADAGTDAGATDAGPRPDAGADAGHADAGADAGALVSFAADVAPIFGAHCNSCHGWSYGTTVNAASGCGGIRVVPGNPNTSVLYGKVIGAPACGGSMPPNGSLNATDLATLLAWITQGALNN